MATNPSRKQITIRGVAQQSGLGIFVSSYIYDGEFLSLGQPLLTSNIDSATDYATTAADPQLDAVTNSLPSTANIWYKYHTSGSPYTNIVAPSISGNFVHFRGHKSGGDLSYGGIYQKLSGLTISKEYYVDVTIPYMSIAGTFTIKTYYDTGSTVTESSSKSFTMPHSGGNMTTTFTATSESDIILFDFTTASTSAVIQHVYSISIKEKQEYLVPLYASDSWGNSHKVLRRNLGNTLSDD
tara:strand:+ start:520 stop:1239 length:720 start_codon:yes stop_codon:yes gene_type:complete